MQALILAAGMGKRLKNLTRDNTKCMVKVNGVTLIDRMLHQLEGQQLSRIVIVVGYEGQRLIDYIGTLGITTPIEFVNNPVYDRTNNIYSLALAKDWLCREDTILMESDIIFEDSVLEAVIEDPRETVALVDKYRSWMDETCVKLGPDDEITEFIPESKFRYDEVGEYYKTVNIYKFSRHFSETQYVPFVEAYQSTHAQNGKYEQVLRIMTLLDNPEIRACRLNGQKWYEIDDIQDLDIAESIFMQDEDKRVKLLQNRFGGYWRYPQLLDFFYLVNPYFPPQRMMDEMKASFETLISQYPSGMGVNSLLAARNFGVNRENIIVGNGTSELIKALMESLTGKVGVVRPTFEEYGHRYQEEDIVAYTPDNEDFRYNIQDIENFFGDRDIDNLIIINPDNPSGNYIYKSDLIKLAEWTEKKNIKLIVDESFVDFADEEDSTLIEQGIIDTFGHLYVLKSIAKSYGIPGLRLGVLVSGDVDAIAAMKKDVAIWNINSFAEFYMQIGYKYKKDYAEAMDKFRAERARYVARLAEVPGLHVIPSQANYVMAELTNGMTADGLNKELIVNHNIMIKSLTAKIDSDRQYIRLAVKTREEDDMLVEALKKVMGSVQ
ncbi:MAG: aminotransferase class I/II-fold pyridoxal phosphate-dependent enzyme [Butyrivibrio sp.]